jgi:hypothetical protein
VTRSVPLLFLLPFLRLPSARRDKQLRIYDFRKGKMKRRYSESVETYQVCGALWCVLR